MYKSGETVYVKDERYGFTTEYVVSETFGDKLVLTISDEDKQVTDRELIVGLSQTAATLKRRIDELEEEYKRKVKESDSRIEMIEEDVERIGRKATEADYKAGQALTTSALYSDKLDFRVKDISNKWSEAVARHNEFKKELNRDVSK